ncbi:putative helicase [Salmonella phage fmb-p1]|uniref:Putative helicase n=1 Tax=Salmonella phage fmb-p1 TaxID=2849081 RepID=A0A8F2JFF8_9CAUD|nr:putative helicase [Salmonella phage fmb-p1]QWT71864.1 putative helicase [Salmonella phage fmb-p1]
MNNEFDIDACNELIKDAINSREQLLAMQLKREIKRIRELEEEVLRLRQQRDAANAQLDWLLEQPEVDKERGAK